MNQVKSESHHFWTLFGAPHWDLLEFRVQTAHMPAAKKRAKEEDGGFGCAGI